MILFLVTKEGQGYGGSKMHVITFAQNRDEAVRIARRTLVGDHSNYIVTPLSAVGDAVFVDMRLV